MDNSWLNQFVIDGTISCDQLTQVEKIAKLRLIATDKAMIELGYVDEWRLMQAQAVRIKNRSLHCPSGGWVGYMGGGTA